MWFKRQMVAFILLLALSPGHATDTWKVLRQNKSQTLLASSNGVIFIESGKQGVPDSLAKELLKMAQTIYPDGIVQSVDSLQQIAPNLVGRNFRVLRKSYLPPLEEKLRVLFYADTLFSVKFIGTTRTQNFQFLKTNLDFLAAEFQKKQNILLKKMSVSAP